MIEYLIAHIGHTLKGHEHITWWKADSRGYTVCIDKAGRYTEERARAICSTSGGACVAVEPEALAALSRSTPYYRRSDGSLNKLYDGGPHRVIPNDADAWRHIMNECLPASDKPARPTPISVSKARAIYLDGLVP